MHYDHINYQDKHDMSLVYRNLDYERRKPVEEKTLTEQLFEVLRRMI